MKAYDLELEKDVLADILLGNTELVDMLDVEDFYKAEHKQIFSVVKELTEQGQVVDVVRVTSLMKDRNMNAAYIKTVLADAKTVNVQEAVNVLKEKAKIRKLIRTGEAIINIAKDDIEWSHKVNKIHELLNNSISDDVKDIYALKDIILEFLPLLEDRYKGKEIGLNTGFDELDKKLGGLRKGELIIVAGRPSMGKSAFALDIALNVAKRGGSVLFISLEMSKEQIAERALVQISVSEEKGIPGEEIRTGKISDRTWQQIGIHVSVLGKLPIYVVDNTDLDIMEIRTLARQFKRQQKLDLIIVDYLQLIEGSNDTTYENRQETIARVSRNLKKMAKELDVPVIAVSQLNRIVEQRSNKRPILSDLRDSGAIEQDADVVIFLYRDEYYHPDTKDKGIAEVIIAKHRMGPVGIIKLRFFENYVTFRNPA